MMKVVLSIHKAQCRQSVSVYIFLDQSAHNRMMWSPSCLGTFYFSAPEKSKVAISTAGWLRLVWPDMNHQPCLQRLAGYCWNKNLKYFLYLVMPKCIAKVKNMDWKHNKHLQTEQKINNCELFNSQWGRLLCVVVLQDSEYCMNV